MLCFTFDGSIIDQGSNSIPATYSTRTGQKQQLKTPAIKCSICCSQFETCKLVQLHDYVVLHYQNYNPTYSVSFSFMALQNIPPTRIRVKQSEFSSPSSFLSSNAAVNSPPCNCTSSPREHTAQSYCKCQYMQLYYILGMNVALSMNTVLFKT